MDVDNTYFFQEIKFHEQDIHKALIFNLNVFMCSIPLQLSRSNLHIKEFERTLTLISLWTSDNLRFLPLLHYEVWSVWWKNTNVPASMIKETK